MNYLFEKYRPSSRIFHSKGDYLLPIQEKDNSVVLLEMEEHKIFIYGNIVSGLIIATSVLFIMSKMNATQFGIALLCFIGFNLLASFILIYKGIQNVKDSNNKSNLSITSERIKYYDSIKSESITIKWNNIKESVIKFYHHEDYNENHLLILTKQEKVFGLDITYLYEKGQKPTFQEKCIGAYKIDKPRIIKLRKILGKYLQDKK